ncbi:MAG: hypothetical protein ACFWUC_02155 [Oscillospiraceae bacterium]
MKITIEGEPKEIAVIELALKSGCDVDSVAKEIAEKMETATTSV